MGTFDSYVKKGKAGAAPAAAPAPSAGGGTFSKYVKKGRQEPAPEPAAPPVAATSQQTSTPAVAGGKVAVPAQSLMGASNLRDPASGRPYVTFKDIVKKRSVLDTTRVAPEFDPFVKMTHDVPGNASTTNPRLSTKGPDGSAAIRSEMGANDNQQLDHRTGLQILGSNNRSNLAPVDLVDGKQPLLGDENRLGEELRGGKKSLYDVQRENARIKGLPPPGPELSSRVPQPAPAESGFSKFVTKGISKVFEGAAAAKEKLSTLLMPGGAMLENTKNLAKTGYKIAKTILPEKEAAVLEQAQKTGTSLAKETISELEPYTGGGMVKRGLNTEVGRKALNVVQQTTSNIPIDVAAQTEALFTEKTLPETLKAWHEARNNPENPQWKQVLYNLQDSGVQSAIGTLIAIGMTAVTKNPAVGESAAMTYYSAISAAGQQDERGQVDSLTNIGIDTVGDMMLSNAVESILSKPAELAGKQGLKALLANTAGGAARGTLTEGGTEVSQSLLKFANDYSDATTEAERQKVVDATKRYVLNGGIVMEFLVAGLSGGAQGGAAGLANTVAGPIDLNPSMQPPVGARAVTAEEIGAGSQEPDDDITETVMDQTLRTYRASVEQDEKAGIATALHGVDTILESKQGERVAQQRVDAAVERGFIPVQADNTVIAYGPEETTGRLVSLTTEKTAANTTEYRLPVDAIKVYVGGPENEILARGVRLAELAGKTAPEAPSTQESGMERLRRVKEEERKQRLQEQRLNSAVTGQPIELIGYAGIRSRDSGFRAAQQEVAEGYRADRGGELKTFTETFKNPYVAQNQTVLINELIASGSLTTKDQAIAQKLKDDFEEHIDKHRGTWNTDKIVKDTDNFIRRILSARGYDAAIYPQAGEWQSFEVAAKNMDAKTQKAKVAEVVKDGPKSIKDVAEATGILEPNVRRILGVGAKEGTFERVDQGVYVLRRGDEEIAYIEAGEAQDVLARMAEEGKKFDMIFLDPAYFSRALIGGNRGIKKYEFIMPEDFAKVMDSVAKLTKSDSTHVYLMLSGARTARTDMEKYTDAALEAGFQPVGEGGYTKLTKAGQPVTNVRGKEAAPERVILFTQSGKARAGEIPVELNFRFIRPSIAKSYSTEKAPQLMHALIMQSTLKGEQVLDPFAGSGVTGAEALKAGRKVTLVEKKADVVEKVTKPRVEAAGKRIGLMDYDPSYTENMRRLIKEAQDNGDSFPFLKFNAEEQAILDRAWTSALNGMIETKTKKAPAKKPAAVKKATAKKAPKVDKYAIENLGPSQVEPYYYDKSKYTARLGTVRDSFEPVYIAKDGTTSAGNQPDLFEKDQMAPYLYDSAAEARAAIAKMRAAPEAEDITDDIEALTDDLQNTYLDAEAQGEEDDDARMERIQGELDGIYNELFNAAPGKRWSGINEGTGERFFGADASTFPSWIPEDLRSSELFGKVLGNMTDIRDLAFPEGNRPKQRALVNEILDELDSRLGVDTSETRRDILLAYGDITETKARTPAPREADSGAQGSEEPTEDIGDLFFETSRPRSRRRSTRKVGSALETLAAEARKYKDAKEFAEKNVIKVDPSMLESSEPLQGGPGARSTTKTPVDVWLDIDTGVLLIEDGHHRVAEALARGDETIDAHITVTRADPEEPGLAEDVTDEFYTKAALEALKVEARKYKSAEEFEKGFYYRGVSRDGVIDGNYVTDSFSDAQMYAGKDGKVYAIPRDKVSSDMGFGREGVTKTLSGPNGTYEARQVANIKPEDAIEIPSRLTDLYHQAVGETKLRGTSGLASFGAHKSINSLIPSGPVTSAVQTPGKNFKLTDRAQAIVEEFGMSVAEKELPRRLLGRFRPSDNKVRVQALYDLVTVVHEATHGIDEKHGVYKRVMALKGHSTTGAPIYAAKTLAIRRELTKLYTDLYPIGNSSHPLIKRVREGIASLVENYFYSPAMVAEQYPLLVDAFLKPGGEFYHPDMTKLLTMANAIVEDYAQLTPEERIGTRIRTGREVVDRDKGFTFGQRATFEVFNKFEPLNRIARQAGVAETWEDPTVQAFQLMNKNTIIHAWLTGEQTPVLKADGDWRLEKGSIGSYMKLIEGREDAFRQYLVARRVLAMHNKLAKIRNALQSSDLMQADDVKALKEAYITLRDTIRADDFSLQDATAAVGRLGPSFEEAAAGFDAINERLLDFAAENGLISKAQAETWKAEEGYASFRRWINDNLDSDSSGTVSTSNRTKVSSFKARTGSKLDIVDPVFNQRLAVQEIIGKSMENRLWERVANLAAQNREVSNRFEKLDTQTVFDEKTGMVSYPQERDPNVIRVFKAGKRTFYKAGPEFLAVAKVLRPSEIGAFGQALQIPTSVFTRLTTSANPFFALGNLTVDQVSAITQSKAGFVPVMDPAKSLVAWVTKNEEFVKYLAVGGERQTLASFYDLSPDELAVKLEGGKTALDKTRHVIDSAIHILEVPSNVSELMTRFGEYKRSVDRGEPTSVAMYRAAEVTTPFGLSGNLGGAVGQKTVRYIPYLNAIIQVMYKFGRTSKENPKRVATVAAALLVTALTTAIAAMKYSSDEQKRLLGSRSAKELARYIYFPSPNGKDLLRMRIPEQFGAITGLAYLWAVGNYGGNKATFDNYLDVALSAIPDQVNVARPKQLVLSWIPQYIAPSISVVTNTKDYPEILPIVPQSMQDLPPEEQYTAYTSRVAKWLGQTFNASPMLIDYWIKNQFGTASAFLLGKLPTNPLYISEGDYVMSGRAYNHFYDGVTVAEQQYQVAKLHPDRFDEGQVEKIKETRKLYNDVSAYLKDARTVSRDKELPEEVIEGTYELLNLLAAGGSDEEVRTKLEALQEPVDELLPEE